MKENNDISLLKEMTQTLRHEIEKRGGSIEFAESIHVVGRLGDKAATKYLFVKEGKLYAHLYSAWFMENTEACIEHESSLLSEKTLKDLIVRLCQYKVVVSIEGNCVEDILRLPCVKGCEKTATKGVYRFTLYRPFLAYPTLDVAHTGDVICEDYQGNWHVLNDDFLKNLDK